MGDLGSMGGMGGMGGMGSTMDPFLLAAVQGVVERGQQRFAAMLGQVRLRAQAAEQRVAAAEAEAQALRAQMDAAQPLQAPQLVQMWVAPSISGPSRAGLTARQKSSCSLAQVCSQPSCDPYHPDARFISVHYGIL